MVGICGIILLLGCLLLAVVSGQYQGDPFRRMGRFVYEWSDKRRIRFRGNVKVKKDLEGLYSVQVGKEQYRDFYVEKFRLMLLVLLCGTIVALLVWGKNCVNNGKMQEISREEAGGGVQKLHLEATVGKKKAKVWLEVEERLLREEEVEAHANLCMEAAEDLLRTPQYAGKDIGELPDMLEGYPFEILWRRTGEKTVTGYFYYGDRMFCRDYQVDAEGKTENLTMEEKLQEAIELENLQTGTEASLRLPQQLEGESVSWKEVREDNSGWILLLTVLATVGIYFLKDKDLHDEWQKRKKSMRMEYPLVLNKLILYLGAGMTVRGSFVKIAQDRQKKRKGTGGEIYQEMLYACNELNAGVSESLVYQRFGQRTGLEEYTRLATMLNQNIKKGNATLFSRLREESEKAQKENLHMKRKMGEEAQTKLLIPMILMMTIVMLLVILPAFSSF